MTDDLPPPAIRPHQPDWEQFAPLYDEHNERLFRIALLLCNGREAMAEDATAETFVRVYHAWADGSVDHFPSYARQALVNHVLGQFRSEQVAERYVVARRGDGRGQRNIEDTVTDTDTAFELLGQLPVGQRTAVVLRYYEDLPYEQIATTMNVTLGTAKSHVSMGLKRLREQLREGEG